MKNWIIAIIMALLGIACGGVENDVEDEQGVEEVSSEIIRRGAELADCFDANGNAGTCWPSVNQCQWCCDATLNNCVQRGPAPRATGNVFTLSP